MEYFHFKHLARTHPPKRLAHPRSPIPPLSTLTSRATHAYPTSPRSTGFCAIWDCISSSSRYSVTVPGLTKGACPLSRCSLEPRRVARGLSYLRVLFSALVGEARFSPLHVVCVRYISPYVKLPCAVVEARLLFIFCSPTLDSFPARSPGSSLFDTGATLGGALVVFLLRSFRSCVVTSRRWHGRGCGARPAEASLRRRLPPRFHRRPPRLHDRVHLAGNNNRRQAR